jgi:two-component system, OmpR family, sensor histidine kinase KdpD
VIRLPLRLLASLAGVGLLTFAGKVVFPVNATTMGLAYLILVLLVATTWGFIESALASVAATFTFNFYFLPPFGTMTIEDPQNYVAMFSFLTTSLVASRLSAKAERRALDAVERRQDVERLYTFSRAILLIEGGEPFAKQLALKLAEVFQLEAVVLYDRRTGDFFRAGPFEFEGLDDQLRDAALHGSSFSDPACSRIITAVRLGSEPIASLALQGFQTPDSVLQGIANLVAIGLERARAQDLAHQVEAARQSEQLRTTLIDAMAHEFKTPLTSIRAATTSLLSDPDQPREIRTELLKVADEETEHLVNLIDDAVEMGRLDTTSIEVQLERSNLTQVVQELVASMRKEFDGRVIDVQADGRDPAIPVDRRLVKLALKQLLDNALKYSPPETSVHIKVSGAEGSVAVDVTDHGKGIPPAEQPLVFQRFWRSPSVKKKMPGTGLGLSIAHGIARAHNGDLTVMSRPGETTFRLSLPTEQKGEPSA